MVDKPILLSAIWIALMLTYLLGDVLRIYSGDVASGKMGHEAPAIVGCRTPSALAYAAAN